MPSLDESNCLAVALENVDSACLWSKWQTCLPLHYKVLGFPKLRSPFLECNH